MRRQHAAAKSRRFLSLALSPKKASMACGSLDVSHSRSVMAFLTPCP
jgi:hypothetical protein